MQHEPLNRSVLGKFSEQYTKLVNEHRESLWYHVSYGWIHRLSFGDRIMFSVVLPLAYALIMYLNILTVKVIRKVYSTASNTINPYLPHYALVFTDMLLVNVSFIRLIFDFLKLKFNWLSCEQRMSPMASILDQLTVGMLLADQSLVFLLMLDRIWLLRNPGEYSQRQEVRKIVIATAVSFVVSFALSFALTMDTFQSPTYSLYTPLCARGMRLKRVPIRSVCEIDLMFSHLNGTIFMNNNNNNNNNGSSNAAEIIMNNGHKKLTANNPLSTMNNSKQSPSPNNSSSMCYQRRKERQQNGTNDWLPMSRSLNRCFRALKCRAIRSIPSDGQMLSFIGYSTTISFVLLILSICLLFVHRSRIQSVAPAAGTPAGGPGGVGPAIHFNHGTTADEQQTVPGVEVSERTRVVVEERFVKIEVSAVIVAEGLFSFGQAIVSNGLLFCYQAFKAPKPATDRTWWTGYPLSGPIRESMSQQSILRYCVQTEYVTYAVCALEMFSHFLFFLFLCRPFRMQLFKMARRCVRKLID